MTDQELKNIARIFKALANPVRLKIVEELRNGEPCLCQLMPLCPMNKSTLSRHVAVLKKCGIVSERREGVRCFLKLEKPSVLRILDCAMRIKQLETNGKSGE